MSGLNVANKEKIFQIIKEEDKEIVGMFIMTFKKGEKGKGPEVYTGNYGELPENISEIMRHFAGVFEKGDWKLFRTKK